jgi:hypothetical protein
VDEFIFQLFQTVEIPASLLVMFLIIKKGIDITEKHNDTLKDIIDRFAEAYIEERQTLRHLVEYLRQEQKINGRPDRQLGYSGSDKSDRKGDQ